MAPFFTDIDISKGNGNIVYQVHNDLSSGVSQIIAETVNTEINKQTSTNFSAQWILIATWSDVSPYGNYKTVCYLLCHEYHTVDNT